MFTKQQTQALADYAAELHATGEYPCCRIAVLAPIFEDEDATKIATLRVVTKNGDTYIPTATSTTFFDTVKRCFRWTRSHVEYYRNKRSGRGYSGDFTQEPRRCTCPPMRQDEGDIEGYQYE